MQIDTRGRQVRGFGTWTLTGPGGRQVTYSGWFADAAEYLAANYCGGHWFVAV